MKQTTVELLDDFDGKKADRTVTFSIEGESYEIDLTKTNANKLHKALQPYVQAATKVKSTSSTKRRRTASKTAKQNSAPSEYALIREWAKANDIEVSDRGRIPKKIVDQYREATAA